MRGYDKNRGMGRSRLDTKGVLLEQVSTGYRRPEKQILKLYLPKANRY